MNSYVLITGASSGLGAELARLYAVEGYSLILVARRLQRLQELKTEILLKHKIDVILLEADLSQKSAAEDVFKMVQGRGMVVDILINNAGVGIYGDFLRNSYEQIVDMYQVNVLSGMRLSQLFLDEMNKRNRGQVIFVASVGGFFPGPLMATYFASKAATLSFARALAFELRQTALKISVICPGPFKSEFQQKTFGANRNPAAEHSLASAKSVARESFQDLRKQKFLIVPGWENKIFYLLAKVLPINFVMSFVHQAQKNLKY